MKKEVADKILAENRQGYNLIAQKFSHTRKFPWREFEFFKEYVQPSDEVLDAGCGSGRLYEFLAKSKISYTGIDSSQELINIAKTNYPSANFVIGDILNLPFSDHKFNVVFCVATLHHIPSNQYRNKVISEFSRVLIPSGYLIITNWNLQNIQWWSTLARFSLLKLLGLSKLDWRDVQKPWKDNYANVVTNRYLHAFTKKEISSMFQKNNLIAERQFYTKKYITARKLIGFNLISIARKT